MEKEFNLSEKIHNESTDKHIIEVIEVDDVKKAVRLLKEIKFNDYDNEYINNLIDKIFGDKLTGASGG